MYTQTCIQTRLTVCAAAVHHVYGNQSCPYLRVSATGPSATCKEQLLQRLVEEFPQVFQAVACHTTPAYGQDPPASGQPVEPGCEIVVSTEDFKVCLLQAPDTVNELKPLRCNTLR